MSEFLLRYQPILRPLLRVSPLLGGMAILYWRVHETRVPLSRRGLVIPPLAMSTGLAMFLSPGFRIPLWWATVAFVVGGSIFSYPLIRSSHLELRNSVVYLQRSRSFLTILLGLLALRLLLHDVIGHLITPLQTAAVFYLLAFGMILRWRLMLFRAFVQLTAAGEARQD